MVRKKRKTKSVGIIATNRKRKEKRAQKEGLALGQGYHSRDERGTCGEKRESGHCGSSRVGLNYKPPDLADNYTEAGGEGELQKL